MENLFVFLQREILLVVALAILLVLFLRRESAAGGEKLSVTQTIREVNAETALFVDVRDAKEFTQGHVSNAINIPHNKLADGVKTLEKHRNKRIILVDKMGQHAGAAGKLLAKQGFNVARMQGGMDEWRQLNLPLIKKGKKAKG
ncbi:MAG: rhodanese-like domain-containing protein [Cellvibrionaceae bacterium]|nr:rhodanese-like domain-containing protein [Cellvibrionaceae bacterium]